MQAARAQTELVSYRVVFELLVFSQLLQLSLSQLLSTKQAMAVITVLAVCDLARL